ncbi:nicotinate-nucleotide--dimethylbenzimidazole phosphoribosyltransferase [Hahella sp. SMD15-11]|uniref:Nicotinate-nucleotide--dimethylbenzimidazole phosphoribosyltransferase n=1 Tax=Thermohahella caldifontis TaxID=3142973 RepID=A0AB39UWV6_9GAMM
MNMPWKMPDITPVDGALDQALRDAIDRKTKPPGALGVLESLAFQVGRVQGTLRPLLSHPHLWVFAADHGVAKQGVSAYPQDVTWQMVLNFLSGGAAINVFARHHGIRLQVVDVGVAQEPEARPDLIRASIRPGTRDFTEAPAMTAGECDAALAVGAAQIRRARQDGANAFLFGEMGIGNTTPATALCCRLLGLPVNALTGRGTGVNDEQLVRKREVIGLGLRLHNEAETTLQVLAALGGLEIAAMTGAMLEAAHERCIFVVDGFIATAAYVVAWCLAPDIADYAIFAHCSGEQGHRLVLDALGARPLLDLGLRLGEGTGAALAWPLITSAVAFLNEMASFEQAGVSDRL